MFRKILIANRGEIACRVMETAQKLGVLSVAVYSDADANARHVALADQAVHIGGSAPAQSYLRGDVIIQAALDTGAEAIHPGYGFLSENPEFVEAVEAAGLVFIGPSAAAIRAMGLKDAAKVLMQKAGVPVVPGYHGENQDTAFLAAQAKEIGYPVLIKAVAGGGGKGMRMVEEAAQFDAELQSARGEAQTAFGNGDVLIEKYVTSPRHIEVQVFGDGQDAVHLFERDCSLQRRHQKVIEEAPAPGMTKEVRDAMGAAAVSAAKAIAYAGAGTIEFIVDASDGLRADRFWFMEMNTRLQVEHPVTEAITGVDLVEWQLRVAAGEALPASQDQISITGHSFEARLYAEDVPAGFLPATGRLSHLAFPDFARADTGVRRGDEISPWYDPMIAKLTVHGPTRAIALAKMERALSATEVGGSVTNLAFLRALTLHAGFAAGQVDTGLIARDLAGLAAAPVACSKTRALAALGFAGLLEAAQASTLRDFALWAPLLQSVEFAYGDDILCAQISARGGGYDVTLNAPNAQNAQNALTHFVERRAGSLWVDHAKTTAKVVTNDTQLWVFWGNCYQFDAQDPLERGSDAARAGNVILAPMPGVVKAVFAAVGAEVKTGDRLAILEAMKMEHSLLAARDGVIAEVMVTEGAQVEAGAALIALTEEEAEA